MCPLKGGMKMPTSTGRNTTPIVMGQNPMLIVEGRIPIPILIQKQDFKRGVIIKNQENLGQCPK